MMKMNQLPDFLCAKLSVTCEEVPSNQPYQALMAIYLLRIALGLRQRMPLSALTPLFNSSLAEYTGLRDMAFLIEDDFDSLEQNDDLIELLYEIIENRLQSLLESSIPLDSPLLTNLAWLTQEMGLTACEQELLAISLLSVENTLFQRYLNDCVEYCSIENLLAVITTRSKADLNSSLSANSRLAQMGLLNPKFGCLMHMLTPPMLPALLFRQMPSAKALLSACFIKLRPGKLTTSAYPDQSADLELLIPYLQQTLEQKQTGINILVYGVSAYSKSELAKALAKSVGCPLFAITETTPDGVPWEPQDRLAACQLAQYWLNHPSRRGLILVECASDLMTPRTNKSLLDDEDATTGITLNNIQQQLTSNPVPIIWILDCKPNKVDPACLSQFTYAIELEKTPEALRQKRIQKATRSLAISNAWQQNLVRHQDIPLAQIEKAAAIAQFNASISCHSPETVMQQVLNSHSRLFTRSDAIPRHTPRTGYDPRFSNTTLPLTDLVRGFQRHPSGTCLFYGASGTGKTAFARHLAEQLGMPLMIKRASDILDMYVGQSERNMAEMFREAKRDGAILLLDEADSLLSDRRDARHSWQISQVNELLVQMECFEGIFICTSNLMDRIDSAAMRRFHFKVQFNYLTPEQRWDLFIQETQRLNLESPVTQEDHAWVKRQIEHHLTLLVPGDFAVLNRQALFSDQSLDWKRVCVILQNECAAKGEHTKKIGFIN